MPIRNIIFSQEKKLFKKKFCGKVLPIIIIFLIAIFIGGALFFTLPESQKAKAANENWYDSSWQYRKRITIDSDKISTTTPNFPVLVSSAMEVLKNTAHGGHAGQEDGYDIIFIDSDGENLLDFEREKYASTTGEIVYWVKTDISSTTDKTIFMYYGNSEAVDLANPAGVWDSNYKMVQHLPESPNDDIEGHFDSTLNDNDGTAKNFQDGGDGTTSGSGKIDGADEFDGADDYINCGNKDSLNITDTITVEAWVNPDTLSELDTILAKLLIPEMLFEGYGFSYCSNKLEFYIIANSEWSNEIAKADLSAEVWSHIVGTYDGQTVKIFVNGIEGTPYIYTGTISSNNNPLVIGSNDNATGGHSFDGTIDEVRISNTARSAGWIITEYNNQKYPDKADFPENGFYNFGDEIYGGDLGYFKITGEATQTAGGSQDITITAYKKNGEIDADYNGDKNIRIEGANYSSNPRTCPTWIDKDGQDRNLGYPMPYPLSFSSGVTQTSITLYKAETAHIKAYEMEDTETILLSTYDNNDLDTVVSAEEKNKLLWVTQPPYSVEPEEIWSAFSIEITDEYGNRISDNSFIFIIDPYDSLEGTGFKSAVDGLATFDDIHYDSSRTITIYGLSGALTPTESSHEIRVYSDPIALKWTKEFLGDMNYQVLLNSADLDGDGDEEIIASDGLPGHFFAYQNDGTLLNKLTIGSGYCGNSVCHSWIQPGVFDFDGDGTDEVMIGHHNCAGSMNADTNWLYGFETGGCAVQNGWTQKTVTTIGSGFVIADLENDDETEIITMVQGHGELYAWNSSGEKKAGFPTNRLWESGGGYFSPMPAVGDINGDGVLEIIHHHQRWINVLSANGNSLSNWPKYVGHLMESANEFERLITNFCIADLNNDGNDEIIRQVGKKIYAWQADGTNLPGWPTDVENVCSSPNIQMIAGPIAGDMDDDGNLEVAVYDGSIFYLFDHQGELLPGWPLEENDINKISSPLVMADIDGDGNQEILGMRGKISGRPAEIVAYHKDGALVDGFPFEALEDYVLTQNSVNYRANIIFADIDGDNKIELVISVYNDYNSKTMLEAYDCEGLSSSIKWASRYYNSQNTQRVTN